MGAALRMVGRDPYLSRAQKLVQARMYAQGLTLLVLLATAMLEVGDASKGRGRWETVRIIDPNDPEHKNLIEKRIHHEAYEGEDLWRGKCHFHPRVRPGLTRLDMVAAEERKIEERKNNSSANRGGSKGGDAKASAGKSSSSESKKTPAEAKSTKES
jgi:hypothetical protein